jgi:hypothetical protein
VSRPLRAVFMHNLPANARMLRCPESIRFRHRGFKSDSFTTTKGKLDLPNILSASKSLLLAPFGH